MINYLKLTTFGPASIRIVIGVIFIITGWPKLLDIQQTQSFFKTILMLVISVSLILTGPGRISIERDILKLELTLLGKDMVFSIREHNSRTQV